ncbi:HMG box protein [Phlyctema vagabunda]|uniref:HMG box protein n=1 Tax=Phlyctema vagabunda TaxID=108571 RepID=A0ABR4PWR2_9HELO
MLSTIGRAAIRRSGAGASHIVPKTTSARSIWYLHRTNSSRSTSNITNRPQFVSIPRRNLATASEGTRKPATKSAKRPAAKKPTAKKAAAKKTATKETSKQPAAKTPKVKRAPVTKVLTEKQKEKAAVQRAALRTKAKLQKLKETALVLSEPKGSTRHTPWTIFMQEQKKFYAANEKITLIETLPALANAYKNLDAAEREKLNHRANETNVAEGAALRKFVELHTPQQIREANSARYQLNKHSKTRIAPLPDLRAPKRPATAYSLFLGDKWKSGDLKGISVLEASKLARKEYVDLSADQRQVYEDRQAQRRQRYIQEHLTVFQQEPAFMRRKPKA